MGWIIPISIMLPILYSIMNTARGHYSSLISILKFIGQYITLYPLIIQYPDLPTLRSYFWDWIIIIYKLGIKTIMNRSLTDFFP